MIKTKHVVHQMNHQKRTQGNRKPRKFSEEKNKNKISGGETEITTCIHTKKIPKQNQRWNKIFIYVLYEDR